MAHVNCPAALSGAADHRLETTALYHIRVEIVCYAPLMHGHKRQERPRAKKTRWICT